MLVLLLCAATAPPLAWADVLVDPSVTLPVTIEKIWYRTAKVRLFGKSYEQSGTLTVTESGIEFSFDKGMVKIPKESVTNVDWGKLSPDIQNEWAIVRYTDSAGEVIAAFKGALFSGHEKDSLIISAILRMTAGAGEAQAPDQTTNGTPPSN